MRMKTSITVAALAVLMVAMMAPAGCGTPNSRTALRASADIYASTIRLLAEYRNAGLIDDAAAERIEQARQLARSALEAWYAVEITGGDPAQCIADFNRSLSQLFAERIAAESQRNASCRTRGLRSHGGRPVQAGTSGESGGVALFAA